MRTAEPRLGVVFEHPEWFTPLFAELDRRAIPHDRIDVSVHGFDLGVRELPWSVVLNRMSPSAYLRGHGQAITYTRECLRYLEATGVDVVNGTAAFELETSKVSQLLRLTTLGLPTPRSRVINDSSLLPAAAAGLRYPVIVKPNIGGSGAGMQRFESPEALRAAAADRTLALGVDHTALVQEFLPARGGHIVRVEFLDGRFLYAIKIYPTLAAGFNLCPADICHPDGSAVAARPGDSEANGGSAAGADLCPVDLPKVALRVEGCTPPAQVIGDVLAIARATGLDLGGVEYLVDDRDGRVYYYDINALSNFVTDAVRLVGFDPYAVLADYLVARGRLREPARLRS
jgi:hypothetical protein